jgi:hypothetical protein
MSAAFDLSSYEDVRTNADRIYQALANGSMPCDGHGHLNRPSGSAAGLTPAAPAKGVAVTKAKFTGV